MKPKRDLYAAFTFFLLLLISGCGKTGIDCFTSTGEIVHEERSVDEFDSIEINNNVNLFISKDSIRKVVVEAGENIITNIITSVENKQLTIRNENTCNWVRSYNKPINVYVSTPYLYKIYYNSSGNVNSLNTLEFDSLKLEAWGGCGTIELDVDIFLGYFYLQLGTSDVHLEGSCGIASMVTGDFGFLDARELQTGFVFIASRSSNDCYVHVVQGLNATIESIGNIYYYGSPKEITTTINGPGSVIQLY